MNACHRSVGLAHGPDRITLQGENVKAATIENNAQGIDQKWHISLIDVNGSIRAVPPI